MLLYSQWMNLPINIRHQIASDFKIQKKTPTHVQDNVIVSDGYNIKEVEAALNVPALQEYLGVENPDMEILWNELVFRMQNPDETRMEIRGGGTIDEKGNIESTPTVVIKKKGGRPKGSKNR